MKINLKSREFKRRVYKNEISFRKTAEDHRDGKSGDLTLYFAFGGKVNYKFGRRQVNVFPGSFLCLKPGTQYHTVIDSPEPVQVFAVAFDAGFVEDFLLSWGIMNSKVLSCESLFDETLYPCVGDIRYTINHLVSLLNEGCQDDLLLSDHLYHCLINFCGVHRREVLTATEKLESLKPVSRAGICVRLHYVREHLYSHYDQDITLEELASNASMSVNYLLRMFKQAFNCSPHQYLMRLRLQRAKEYLENTDYPVNEIVGMIGLTCSSSFIELFRKRYQITPLKYRQLKNCA